MSKFAAIVAAIEEAVPDLWAHRRDSGGPMNYVPPDVNAVLKRAVGEYTATGVLVVKGENFVFHQRPNNAEDPWSGMREWPDVQTTPGLTWKAVQTSLINKGVPVGWFSGECITSIGDTVVWERERGCYCATTRILIRLEESEELSGDWVEVTDGEVQAAVEENDPRYVNYHLAAALWAIDDDPDVTRANLRKYHPGLEAGPLDG